ncbi:MAG: HlyD family efflux transporter periplasmic adaptor subunit [Nostocaceae cyanobacterium]|nr:HlyD family efflux transporter periplasmic adaptor subunit [Nostocaceae cyanobacterium]
MPENHTFNGHIPIQTIPDDHRYDNLLTQQDASKSNNNKSPHTNDWSYATKELLDSLPQVWTRGLLYFLVVFIGIALPWAMFSQVDETGTARGRLEPKGKTLRLDAPVEGTVAAIKVKEGEFVKAGQKLLELKSELVNAELQQQRQKLEGQQNRLHQQNLLKNQLILALHTQQQQNQAQQLEKQAQIEQAQQNIETLKSVHSLQKEELFAQIEQAKQAIESSKVVYELEKIRLKTAEDKIPRYKKAYEQGALSQDRFLEVQQLAKEAEKNMMKAASEIKQAQSRLKEQQGSYEKKIHQASSDIKQAQLRWQEQQRSYKSLVHSGKLAVLKSEEQLNNLDAEMTTVKAEISQSKTQIKSLEFQLSQRVLKAPIDGVIFQLPIKGEGTVVQPGKMIVEIAPQGTSLVLWAQMATRESGSLEKGMPVKIKFDAYPFQDYGVVKGKLIDISPTTSELDTPKGKVAVYNLEIVPNQNCIVITNNCIPFRPGDTVTAEVVVRQRRIIDYIIDPFKKLQQG